MFYCEDCRKRNDYPETISHSIGNCEMCGKRAVCNDLHHSQLPEPKKPEVKILEWMKDKK
jgi:hypothetical protein